MSRIGVLVRVIAALMLVLVAFVTVLAPSRPILAKPTLFGIGVAHLVDLMAEGCGPGWHWSNRRGWNGGRCVLDRRLIWGEPASAAGGI
jgi:fatty acid desaturase